RKGHPAQRRAAATRRSSTPGPAGTRAAGPVEPSRARRPARPGSTTEHLGGRNPVVEALRAGVPATALHVATGLRSDARVREAMSLAGDLGIPILQTGRNDLDRLAGGAAHQGLVLDVAAYRYLHPDDLLARALEAVAPLLVALDGVTDPHNLGAIARSAAAFGAHGLLIPERRAAGVSAASWKASAGALARLPVARATNLVRTLGGYRDAGFVVVGLDGSASTALRELEVATDPLVVVVGSEGRGLSRLVAETCDVLVRIPMSGLTESLNASVAAGIVLAEVADRRKL
ncbi:MAG TPA: 23S rRNA (guanosine(2251)-2'-O)-methyltransferase RlmB, partial [Mycobacteriales bacterium]|nr:23S rRNA (guanosine(2251)-2'-O)-methyltransferase RlmB [Mycobacteriales bacterium]